MQELTQQNSMRQVVHDFESGRIPVKDLLQLEGEYRMVRDAVIEFTTDRNERDQLLQRVTKRFLELEDLLAES